MKKQLLFAFIFCLSILGYSQTFTDNFFTYQVLSPISPYTVTLTDYNFSGGSNVNIPSSVNYNSITYNVVRIGNYAFQGNTSTGEQLTNVVIPNTITYIGLGAFSYNQLTSVVIPNSVTTIENIAFTNNQLTSVTLSNNLVSIPLGIFQGNMLTSITIPNSVTSIQGNAFFNNQLTTITIPSNVVSIGQRAFLGNPLTSVTSLAINPPTAFYGNPDPTIDSFAYNRSTIDLYIPSGTLAAYNAALWIGFNSVTQGNLSTTNFELENEVKIITTENSIKIVASNQLQFENYTVYNLSGQEIAKGIETEIETTTFSSGIYILNLNFDKGSVVKKVLIK